MRDYNPSAVKVIGGKHLVWLALGAILYGFITVGGRLLANLGFSLIEISLYPLAGVTLILLIVRPALLQQLVLNDRIGFFLVYGLIGAVLQVTQYGGIVLGVPVSLVAMLLYLQPIWTMLLGRLFLGEPFTAAKILALTLGVIGSMVLLSPAFAGVAYSTLGLVSAFLGGWALSIWVIWGKRIHRYEGLDPLARVLGYALFTVLWLGLLLLLLLSSGVGGSFASLSTHLLVGNWDMVLLVSVVAYLLPTLLFLVGIRKVEASLAGMILMLEPLSAIVLAAILFREPVTVRLVIGGGLILVANFLTIRASQRPLPHSNGN